MCSCTSSSFRAPTYIHKPLQLACTLIHRTVRAHWYTLLHYTYVSAYHTVKTPIYTSPHCLCIYVHRITLTSMHTLFNTPHTRTTDNTHTNTYRCISPPYVLPFTPPHGIPGHYCCRAKDLQCSR